jgi:hypothetical protein
MLLLSPMIPISLYVTMEIVKNFMKKFMDMDYQMYAATTDTPAAARTATLHEELGQVSHTIKEQWLVSDGHGASLRHHIKASECRWSTSSPTRPARSPATRWSS